MSPRSATPTPRSSCPINLSLEVFGDRWTLLILRDLMFAGKRHFRELLQSDEGISTNILSERLKMLVREGILTKGDDRTHKQKAVYSLTQKGIELLPIIVQIGAWGTRWLPRGERQDPEAQAFVLAIQAKGPAGWRKMMTELRRQHLGS